MLNCSPRAEVNYTYFHFVFNLPVFVFIDSIICYISITPNAFRILMSAKRICILYCLDSGLFIGFCAGELVRKRLSKPDIGRDGSLFSVSFTDVQTDRFIFVKRT